MTSNSVIRSIREALARHGVTIEGNAVRFHLVAPGSQGTNGTKTDGSARHRNPDNPEQTWSGRGRRPRWIHDAEAAGRFLEELRVS